MEMVMISPKYQVVIPRRIREALELSPGQKVRVMQFDRRVEYVPVVPIAKTRGFLKGIKTDVPRETDRR